MCRETWVTYGSLHYLFIHDHNGLVDIIMVIDEWQWLLIDASVDRCSFQIKGLTGYNLFTIIKQLVVSRELLGTTHRITIPNQSVKKSPTDSEVNPVVLLKPLIATLYSNEVQLSLLKKNGATAMNTSPCRQDNHHPTPSYPPPTGPPRTSHCSHLGRMQQGFVGLLRQQAAPDVASLDIQVTSKMVN